MRLKEAKMVPSGTNSLIVRPIWIHGPPNAVWSKNVSHCERCLNSRAILKEAYKQVPAEPSLAGFALMVQWHPQKCCPVFLVGRTQFFGGKSCPVNFARVSDWCCHALATIAGMATSHCVDDVLAVDRKTTILSGWIVWRVLSSLLLLGHTRGQESPYFTSPSHSWSEVRPVTDTRWPPNAYNHTRQNRAIDEHGERHFRIWSLTTGTGRQSVGTIGVQLHSDVWPV